MALATIPASYRPSLRRRLARGLAAGVVGTAMLALSDRVERLVLDGPPLYSPTRIGRRLVRRHLPRSSPLRGSSAGAVLRWAYGPLWGGAFGALRPLLPRRPLAAAPILSAAIYLAEITVFPLVGATPPIEQWPPVERGALLFHTSAYALATALGY